jgi:hypothetical protein
MILEGNNLMGVGITEMATIEEVTDVFNSEDLEN